MTEPITYLSKLYDFEQVEGDDAGSQGALHVAMCADVPAGGQWWRRGDHPELFKVTETGETDLVMVINPLDSAESLSVLNPDEDGCVELPAAALAAMRRMSHELKRGDRVVFDYDEPALNLSGGTPMTVTAVRGQEDLDVVTDDGREFTTEASMLRSDR